MPYPLISKSLKTKFWDDYMKCCNHKTRNFRRNIKKMVESFLLLQTKSATLYAVMLFDNRSNHTVLICSNDGAFRWNYFYCGFKWALRIIRSIEAINLKMTYSMICQIHHKSLIIYFSDMMNSITDWLAISFNQFSISFRSVFNQFASTHPITNRTTNATQRYFWTQNIIWSNWSLHFKYPDSNNAWFLVCMSCNDQFLSFHFIAWIFNESTRVLLIFFQHLKHTLRTNLMQENAKIKIPNSNWTRTRLRYYLKVLT